jgi:hypothetical protein
MNDGAWSCDEGWLTSVSKASCGHAGFAAVTPRPSTALTHAIAALQR